MTDKIEKPIKSSKIAIGFDVGTMNLCCARSDSKDINLMRNVFLKIDQDEINLSDLSNVSYVKNSDGTIYIVGQEAFQLANIFGQKVSRPMESGLISSKEIDAIEVLALMIKSLVGNFEGKDVYCCYSIPAEAIDESRSVTYHEKVFGRIFSSMGINHKPINEAMAIIYSECANENFSGIGISFGAGMCNVAIAYKGIETLTFSTARSGDWIDKNVAESLNTVSNRITSVKEKNFSLKTSIEMEKDKKKRRIIEALTYYYNSLIEYTVKKIIKEFNDKVDMEIDGAIPIVISGGTSIPEGFVELFKDTMDKYNLPFEISEVRHAKNPLTAVANGLLYKSLSEITD